MSAGNLEAVSSGTLADVLDRILDKGVVINADITVSLVGVELLGLKIRLALASFETAALYGLEFPGGTNLETPAWRELRAGGNGEGTETLDRLAVEGAMRG